MTIAEAEKHVVESASAFVDASSDWELHRMNCPYCAGPGRGCPYDYEQKKDTAEGVLNAAVINLREIIQPRLLEIAEATQ